MQQASRHDLARALVPRYAHASRREKVQLLDEFCAITGYTRKHAVVLLSNPPAEERERRVGGRLLSYGPAEVALLRSDRTVERTRAGIAALRALGQKITAEALKQATRELDPGFAGLSFQVIRRNPRAYALYREAADAFTAQAADDSQTRSRRRRRRARGRADGARHPP